MWQEVLRKSYILSQAARPNELITDGCKIKEEVEMFSCSGSIQFALFRRGSNRLSSLSFLIFPAIFHSFTAASIAASKHHHVVIQIRVSSGKILGFFPAVALLPVSSVCYGCLYLLTAGCAGSKNQKQDQKSASNNTFLFIV